MILAEFSMFPLGKSESVSPYVARSLEIIDKSGLPYRMGSMGTTLEGEWDDVMGVIQKCYEAMRKDCHRIECSISIDSREGENGRIVSKIKSVETKVGKKLKT
jgi:uncharacterized protein (TIGR00106 family)